MRMKMLQRNISRHRRKNWSKIDLPKLSWKRTNTGLKRGYRRGLRQANYNNSPLRKKRKSRTKARMVRIRMLRGLPSLKMVRLRPMVVKLLLKRQMTLMTEDRLPREMTIQRYQNRIMILVNPNLTIRMKHSSAISQMTRAIPLH